MSILHYEDQIGQLFNGDALEVLESLETKVDMCVTSPPYWALRDYHTASWVGGDSNCDHVQDETKTKVFGNPEFNKNRPSRKATKLPGYYYDKTCEKCGAVKTDIQLGQEKTFEAYINRLCDYFDKVWYVLKDEGSLWVNLGDTYYGSNKGSGGKTQKQLTNPGSYFYNKGNKESDLQNASEFNNKELPRKSLCLIPSRFAIEMQNRGWILRNDIIWHKPNQFPQSAKDRFTQDYEHLFFFTKMESGYYYEQQLEPAKESSIKRHNYGWKGAVDDGVAWAGNESYIGSEKAKAQILKGRNMRTVWSINTESKKGLNHFATYPRKLIETPIKSGCPEGGTVLDIFFGAGTTGLVSESLNRKWIGIELNQDYCKTATERIINGRE